MKKATIEKKANSIIKIGEYVIGLAIFLPPFWYFMTNTVTTIFKVEIALSVMVGLFFIGWLIIHKGLSIFDNALDIE